ncbi:acyl carrier protein [Paenibacillus pinihumi]|uniref:acyl carrier protein n=1 Tax=Paenibacillus pinihumi TaxID=669462 RepID=UPI000413A3B0|nr:acyl carrier protein [Paenibacillus pinihumi]
MNLMEQQTAERITEIIRKITGYSDRIVWEENLSTYGMNSMKTMELVIALEIEFNIQFEDEELVLGRFSSARNIMEQLKLKLQREA